MLSPAQQRLVLDLFPDGTRIRAVVPLQQHYTPCPLRVQVLLPDATEQVVVLRLARHDQHGVAKEAQLYPLLAQLGLPVPQVLAEPRTDPDAPELGEMSVLSLLPGRNLQAWSAESPAGLELACRLVIDAVGRLQQLTAPIMQIAHTGVIPQVTLADELRAIEESGSVWLQDEIFRAALTFLKPRMAHSDLPLVFSNGDYQPANFLSDGRQLTGFVDFEGVCFEDPYIGFAKYRIYDIHPCTSAGIVERYLAYCGGDEAIFAPRLGLRCLSTLQGEISLSSQEDAAYRDHVKTLLRGALIQMAS